MKEIASNKNISEPLKALGGIYGAATITENERIKTKKKNKDVKNLLLFSIFLNEGMLKNKIKK